MILGITLDQGRAAVAPAPAPGHQQTLDAVPPPLKLQRSGVVKTWVDKTESKVNVLQYELRTPPPTQTVCTDCAKDHARSLGFFNADTQLVFYLVDRTYNQTYASTDANHARVEYKLARVGICPDTG